jgi:predicted nucleic acid-binding protein
VIVVDTGVLYALADDTDTHHRRCIDWLQATADELVRAYDNLSLGTVDAGVIAVAERLKVDTVATIARRDFAIVRPAHVRQFTLVPELAQ